MKKITIIPFAIILSMYCYGAGARQDVLNDRYSYNMSRVIENYYNNLLKGNDKLERTIIKEFNEIKNGLYIMTQEYISRLYGQTYNSIVKTICYNVNNANRDTNSEIRFIEILNIFDNNCEIIYTDKNIEILTIRMNDILEGGYLDRITEEVKIVFEFDEMDKLKSYKIINRNDNRVIESYLYCYDIYKQLNRIYSVNERGDNILRKSIYYDGQLRMMERPFFNNISQENIDEIVIFNENKLKYHIRRYIDYPHREGSPAPDDIWLREEWHYHILFEFNNNGDEIRQTMYPFNGSVDRIYEKEYLEYDNMNNWIHSREKANDEKEYHADYKRIIEYKN
jgi:hypothetical protein